MPLTDAGGRISGLLQIPRHGSDFDDYLGQWRRHTLLMVLVSALVLIALLLTGHCWVVGRHLREIEAGLQRIGQGEMHHHLHSGGAHELGSPLRRQVKIICNCSLLCPLSPTRGEGARSYLHSVAPGPSVLTILFRPAS